MKLKYVLIGILTIAVLASCKSKKRIARKNKKQQKEVVIAPKEKKSVNKVTKVNTTIKNTLFLISRNIKVLQWMK